MTDYGAAFKRPFSDLKKLVIGILLNILPIVNFLAWGYQLNCAKLTMQKKSGLPEWADWTNLFLKGLWTIIIVLVYSIPATLVMIIAAASIVLAIFSSLFSGGTQMPDITAPGIAFLIALVLILLTAYIVPSAIMMYVRDENFRDAFKFREVFRNAFTLKYLVVWVIAAIYFSILMGVLSLIPFIGGAVGGFIAGVTGMTLFAESYPTAKKK